MGERRGDRSARRDRLRSAALRCSQLGGLLAAALGLAGCPPTPPPGDVEVKEAYFSLGNVELFRSAPEVLVVRSGITDVQYGLLFPFGAAVIALLVSTIAYARGRRQRRADWAVPLGSAIVAAMLGLAGWSATTIQTTINQPAETVQVEQRKLWGTVPSSVQLRFDHVDDVRMLYRSERGAYCAAVLRKKPDDGSELPLFRFVDILTAHLDLAQCEHLRHRLAQALRVEARDEPELRTW